MNFTEFKELYPMSHCVAMADECEKQTQQVKQLSNELALMEDKMITVVRSLLTAVEGVKGFPSIPEVVQWRERHSALLNDIAEIK